MQSSKKIPKGQLDIDDLVTANHSHSNKTLLDSYDQSNIDITAAINHSGLTTGNPHNVTASEVGLGNVNNTSDIDKPISNATQSALDDKADSTDLANYIPLSDKGANGGVAELDNGGKIPVSQLPSYVSDVETYPTLSSFPTTGDDNIIYIAEDTNLTYRWTGSAYVEISPSIALGETSATAYRGDRGKTAYDHSQLTSGNPHNVSKTDVGLGNVPNTNFTSAVNANTAKRTYPLVDENKLAGIEANAQKNVKSDWNASSGDAEILNKPINLSDFNNDGGYLRDIQLDNKTINLNGFSKVQAIALEVKHGTSVDFSSNQVLYSHTTPGTVSNILQVLTGAKLGVCNKIYHFASSEPTYPTGWVKLGDGHYEPNQLNIIFAEYCGVGRIEYWIVQEN